MTNREFMQTLSDPYFESAMWHIVNMDFDIADTIEDPTWATMAWLTAEYDPKDKIWAIINDENDDSYLEN